MPLLPLAPDPPPSGERIPPVRALLAGVCLLGLVGCATAGPAPGDGPGRPGPEGTPADQRETRDVPASGLVTEARNLLDRGRGEAAYRLADSVYFHLLASGASDDASAALYLAASGRAAAGDTAGAAGLFAAYLEDFPRGDRARDASLGLARARIALGDDPGAASAILTRRDPGDGTRPLLRRAARGMSVAELETTLDDGPGESAPWAAELLRDELERARSEASSAGTVRIGVLLPTSGRLESVGRWLRQGIELAVAEPPEGAPAVELVAVDLSSGSGVGAQVASLFDRGVAAIIGPLNDGQLAEAAAAAERRLVVSPTATAAPAGRRPAYALWDRHRRETDVAASLGGWLADAVRPVRAGVLYPATELGRASYLAFTRGLGAGGGGRAASASFDPAATTVEAPVRAVGAFAPDVVFVPAEGSRSVLQLAPQLSYYGLRGTVVAGGPDWSQPSIVRRMEPSFTQYRVVGTYLDRSEGGGWSSFTERYEREYRRSLGDNVLPGLGHDAALLVLRALARTSPARPRAVARRFAALEGVEAATGRLTPDPGTGTVGRRVNVRALGDRELVTTSPEEVRRWLEEASGPTSAQHRRQRQNALRAVRESEIPLDGQPGSGGER